MVNNSMPINLTWFIQNKLVRYTGIFQNKHLRKFLTFQKPSKTTLRAILNPKSNIKGM
jgi:hypothetical protein